MITYLVQIQVLPDSIQDFIEATEMNVAKSRLEEGVLSFDFFQQMDAPNQFVLIEVYQTGNDQLKHRDTPHYQKWRSTVEEMMAVPRKAVKLMNIMP